MDNAKYKWKTLSNALVYKVTDEMKPVSVVLQEYVEREEKLMRLLLKKYIEEQLFDVDEAHQELKDDAIDAFYKD